MKSACALLLALALSQSMISSGSQAQGPSQARPSLWELANQCAQTHRFSTLFDAYSVREHFATEAGIQAAIAWCKETGVTKVYIEEFHDGYQAERATLESAREKFRSAGFEVSGCITTTRVGKASTGWKEVACCYTDKPTQEKLQAIF